MTLRGLRLISDENVSPRVVSFLREHGCDVLDVKEEGWLGADDSLLLRRAWRDKRIVVTHDRDFGRLAIAQGEQCHGIIYIRLRNQRSSNVIHSLEGLMRSCIVFKPGLLMVLNESGVRIRRMLG